MTPTKLRRARWGTGKSNASQPAVGTSLRAGPVAIVLLTALVIGQVIAPGSIREGLLRLTPGGSFVSVGDDLSRLQIPLADHGFAGLGDGRAALLLVFDPDCVHSASVASNWSAWLSSARAEGNRIIAVSGGSLLAAQSYAREHQWPVTVGSLAAEERSGASGAHALTIRTPWVFAVGPEGRVVGEGHGNEVAEVARTLLKATQGDPQ